MCMPYHGMTQEYESGLNAAETLISWLFIIEMAIKLLGLGCSGYWSDRWNQLDGTIVSLSIFEMIMTAVGSGTGVKFTFLRMLRMLRVLRILRLMRSWKGLYTILSTFMRSIHHMSNVVFLIILAMFIFSLLGMQLFGGIYNEKAGYSLIETSCPGGVCDDGLEEKPRHHFDYCFPAMLTVFVLLTGEWIDALKPAADILGTGCASFFIFVVLLGKYLLINLLVAVILHEFQEGESKESELASARGSSRRASAGCPDSARNCGSVVSARSERSIDLGAMSFRSDVTDTARETVRARRYSSESEESEEVRSRRPSSELGDFDDGDDDSDGDKSLGLFGRRHPLRKMCRWAYKQPWWDQTVIIAIVLSSICLALDSPRLDHSTNLSRALVIADRFFTGLFFCEMSTKVVALGFACNGKDSYLNSAWNQIDFIIVMTSLVLLLADAIPQLRPLRVMRVMRVLRPLRLISRNAGMKLIITSLFKAMPAVRDVLGVVFALQVVFAILGMQMFAGAMGSCTAPNLLTEAECKSGGGGTSAPRWANPATGSFDNFGDAMRLLYVMSSGDQWEQPMYAMMGVQGPGVAPIRNDFSLYALFSLAWMFCGYIFAINLFVGVVVDKFSRMQREHDGSATMTREQKQWASTMKSFASLLPTKTTRPPANVCRLGLYHLVNAPAFDGLITGVIVANVGVMACNYWLIEKDGGMLQLYECLMDAFSLIYYVEATAKIGALGPSAYFADAWCRFDFTLVCFSLLDQFAASLLAQFLPIPPMLLRVMRILRILRILRLLKGAKQLRDLILTMMLSFPSLLNVVSLLCLILFIYAVLGVSLFTFVAHGDPVLDHHGGINVQRNFDTFGNAVLVLLQCLTSDGWSTVMADAMMREADGRCLESEGNCGTDAAIPYFVSYQIIGSFILLNLVVAVILENFSTLYFTSPDLVSSADLELFSEAWAAFDPDATNYVPIGALPDLLLRVPRPLGVKGKSKETATRLCLRLNVPQHHGSVAYREVLQELIENNYFKSGADLDEGAFKALPNSVVPPLTLTALPPPPPPQDGVQPGSYADEDDEISRAVVAQDSIAEAFAMAKLFEDAPRDALVRSLTRARLRIALGDRSTFLLAKRRAEKQAKHKMREEARKAREACETTSTVSASHSLTPIRSPASYSAVELVGLGSSVCAGKRKPHIVCASGAIANSSPGVPMAPPAAQPKTGGGVVAALDGPSDAYARQCSWTAIELVNYGTMSQPSRQAVNRAGESTLSSSPLRFLPGSHSSKPKTSTPKPPRNASSSVDDRTSAEKRKPLTACASGAAGVPMTPPAAQPKTGGGVVAALDGPSDAYARQCSWTAIELVNYGTMSQPSRQAVNRAGESTLSSSPLRFLPGSHSSKPKTSTPKPPRNASSSVEDGIHTEDSTYSAKTPSRVGPWDGHLSFNNEGQCEYSAVELVGVGAGSDGALKLTTQSPPRKRSPTRNSSPSRGNKSPFGSGLDEGVSPPQREKALGVSGSRSAAITSPRHKIRVDLSSCPKGRISLPPGAKALNVGNSSEASVEGVQSRLRVAESRPASAGCSDTIPEDLLQKMPRCLDGSKHSVLSSLDGSNHSVLSSLDGSQHVSAMPLPPPRCTSSPKSSAPKPSKQGHIWSDPYEA